MNAVTAFRSPTVATGLGLDALIGNTPLIRLDLTVAGRACRIFAKAEFHSLTGSTKDRMAASVILRARERGELAPGQEIVEMTSGNAGIALAAIGTSLGHKVTIFMPDWMSEERRGLLRSFGANLRLVSRDEGGFCGALDLSEAYAAERGAFLTRQFANADNVRAHRDGTGAELLRQLAALGLRPDAFAAGVGTGGTVMGVAECFAAAGIAASVHPVEPLESPTLSTGHKVGHHRIQGISDEFIPPIVRLDRLARPVAISDSCAIRMAQRLGSELGMGVGISSGANLLAAIEVARDLDEAAVVATVFCDNSLRYLSTDLAREEPARPSSIVGDVRFDHVSMIRAC